MSEIISERLKKSVGKEVKIFLTNDFRYVGKLTNCDKIYVEVLDYKTKSYKIILITEIKDVEIEQ